MGQQYAAAFETYPDTDLVALVDNNAERCQAAAERFSVPRHFRTVAEMLEAVRPEIVSVVTPGAYFHDTVLACASSAGMRAVQVEKPFGGPLSRCDAMVDACAANGVLFCGGNMQVAMPEVQEMAARIASGEFGPLRSASVHGFSGEYVGGGCQHLAVLEALSGRKVGSVIAWQDPPGGLFLPGIGAVDSLDGVQQDGSREPDENHVRMSALFTLRNSGSDNNAAAGINCPCFPNDTGSCRGVELVFDDALVRWNWAPLELFRGTDSSGQRKTAPTNYAPYRWSEFGYLTGAWQYNRPCAQK